MHKLAIRIASCSSANEEVLESILFMNELLCTGNPYCHEKMLREIQTNESFAQLLFSMLKKFFTQKTLEVIQIVKTHKLRKFCNNKDISQFLDYHNLVKALLKMTELLFENPSKEIIINIQKKNLNFDILLELISFTLLILQEDLLEESDRSELVCCAIQSIQKIFIGNRNLILIVSNTIIY